MALELNLVRSDGLPGGLVSGDEDAARHGAAQGAGTAAASFRAEEAEDAGGGGAALRAQAASRTGAETGLNYFLGLRPEETAGRKRKASEEATDAQLDAKLDARTEAERALDGYLVTWKQSVTPHQRAKLELTGGESTNTRRWILAEACAKQRSNKKNGTNKASVAAAVHVLKLAAKEFAIIERQMRDEVNAAAEEKAAATTAAAAGETARRVAGPGMQNLRGGATTRGRCRTSTAVAESYGKGGGRCCGSPWRRWRGASMCVPSTGRASTCGPSARTASAEARTRGCRRYRRSSTPARGSAGCRTTSAGQWWSRSGTSTDKGRRRLRCLRTT